MAMMTRENLKPKAILVSRWGYNCSRYSFYRVEKVSDKSVWIRQINKEYVNGTAPNNPCSEVRPVLNSSPIQSKVSCRRILKGYAGDDSVYIKIGEYQRAYSVHNEGATYNETCD